MDEADRSKAGEAVTERELWSWLDRGAPELDEHLARHPDDAARVEALRATIDRLGEARGFEEPLPEAEGYRSLARIGRGGMGVVYEAESVDPPRAVALKLLPRELAADERRLALFRREAHALARLSHPGIATVYAVGRCADGRPFISMELVRGAPFDRFVKERGLGTREAVALMRRVGEAVGHAHDQGIVHRDLKPANVLVDERGAPKVVDFGLARILGEDATLTRSGSLLGTLPYMSPEQAQGRAGELGPASDVYQLGVMLFELVTGEKPYELEGLSLTEAARRIAEAPPRASTRANDRRLRGELRTIVLHALEKEPSRRYASAGELAADLARWLDGRAIEAVRAPLRRRAWRALRRHWAVSSIALLALAVAAVLLVPVRLPFALQPGWWSEGSPFEEIRWVGERPEVRVEGRWYELVSIDGLKRAYVVGFTQQHADAPWRKRFAEDLVQVLNRMGDWTWRSVDLELYDLETGERVTTRGVRLGGDGRRAAQRARNEWPFERVSGRGERELVRFRGREWELVSIDGVDEPGPNYYDAICDRAGRSPGERVDLVLRDPATGELARFEDVPRFEREDGKR